MTQVRDALSDYRREMDVIIKKKDADAAAAQHRYDTLLEKMNIMESEIKVRDKDVQSLTIYDIA